MISLNKTELIGRLGQDPEVKDLNNGGKVCTFSVATTTKGKDKKEYTEWHSVVVYGKLAEICGQYLKKGQEVRVVGSNKKSSWEKDGVKRSKVDVVVTGGAPEHAVMFGSSKGGDSSSDSKSQAPASEDIKTPSIELDPSESFDFDSE